MEFHDPGEMLVNCNTKDITKILLNNSNT